MGLRLRRLGLHERIADELTDQEISEDFIAQILFEMGNASKVPGCFNLKPSFGEPKRYFTLRGG
jgi:hypothetical protein